jgi:cytochrome c553
MSDRITTQFSQHLLVLCLYLGLFTFAQNLIAADAQTSETSKTELEIGKRIYQQGLLPSGQHLKGKRVDVAEDNADVPACIQCHRGSGMGSLEGNIVVPPISGTFLFSPDDTRPFALLDTRAPQNLSQHHPEYTFTALSKAIRDGVNANGVKMNPLMPRYSFTDAELKALSVYLHQLSTTLSPGVTEDSVTYATIITPDIKPQEKEVMLQMMRTAFKQRNATQLTSSGRMRTPLDLLPRTYREWQLVVWELKGPAETWTKQLQDYYQQKPVFAVISGISNTTWQPMHEFCQEQQLPCLLPSVLMPPKSINFYDIYFSKGIYLEADVLAKHFQQLAQQAPKKLIQVYSDDEVSRTAMHSLESALKTTNTTVEDVVYPKDLNRFKTLNKNDTLVLWLHPEDLAKASKELAKAKLDNIYVSGFLANEHYEALTPALRTKVKVVYPYEVGKSRETNGNKLKAWLNTIDLPLVNEPLQTDVFFNLLFMTDLSSQMLDNFYRDYFVERAEDMLSVGSNITLYPRLSLAAGQRFASKGAYIAKFNPQGSLIAESEWLIP